MYLRASTSDQDAKRAEQSLLEFITQNNLPTPIIYSENFSGTKLSRPELNRLLDDASTGDILLIESVDRLSRLNNKDWDILKTKMKSLGLKLVVQDLPTTHQLFNESDITDSIMSVINNMLIDLLATMARLDQEKRVERIRQGQQRAKDLGKTIGGRSKSNAIRGRIEAVMKKHPNLAAHEIATLTNVGVATVYRVKKEMSLKEVIS
jgi:DNA invertase Pin-like site-specific DNA recombinase